MLNYLWAGMLMVGVVYGAFAGTLPNITTAILDSAKEAIALCITMLGVMSFWSGFMEIAMRAGVIEAMAGKMRVIMHFLFPRVPVGSNAYRYITTNMIANVLGLGWAATPAGLKAMEELEKLDRGDGSLGRPREPSPRPPRQPRHKNATNEMCTFLVINISSLQLIPMNIIAYRTEYGSVNPAAIIFPGIIATAVSTMVAVVFCKWMCRGTRAISQKESRK